MKANGFDIIHLFVCVCVCVCVCVYRIKYEIYRIYREQ